MEERSFKWLLNEMSYRKAKMNILNTMLCSGDSVYEAYNYSASGGLKCIRSSRSVKIKHYLTDLLEERSPKLKEFLPNKPICIVHQDKRIRLLTVSDILQMPSSKIPTMKIQSIHTLQDEGCGFIYRVSVNTHQEIMIKGIYHKKHIPLPSYNERYLRAKEIIGNLGDFVYKFWGSLIQTLSFDMLMDEHHNAYFLKSYRIVLSSTDPTKNRKIPMKMTNLSSFKPLLSTKKQKNYTQCVPTDIKMIGLGQHNFLEMMARTIDKERLAESGKLYFELLFDDSREIETIEDLIDEIEVTRPRVWSRDKKSRKHTLMKKLPPRPNTQQKNLFSSPNLKQKLAIYISDAENRRDKRMSKSQGISRVASPVLQNLRNNNSPLFIKYK